MIRLALLLAGISGAAARPALVHVLHDAGRAALALRGAVVDCRRGRAVDCIRNDGHGGECISRHDPRPCVDADRAATERALDAALTLPDDCYAPRDGAPCWVSDPYAVELAEAEDYRGSDRAAEIEGRL